MTLPLRPAPSDHPPAVCMGELLIDLVAVGAGATIDDAPTFLRAAGGAPANVAVGLARLGARPAFIGKVSGDAFGRFLRTTLESEGVDVRGLVIDPKARTPLAFVGSDGAGGRTWIFYHRGMADTILRPDEVDRDLILGARVFHFGSVSLAAEPGRSATLGAARLARESGCIVSFDPNVRLELWDSPEEARERVLEAIPLAHVVKVSEDETGFITGVEDPAAACRIIRSAGPTLAVVTLGAGGCYYQSPTGEGRVEGFPVTAVETTGAGDAFVAGLIAALAADAAPDAAPIHHGEDALVAALRRANAAGALATTGYGAIPSLPTRDRLEEFLGAGDPRPGG